MLLHEIEHIISKIKYKDDWTFEVIDWDAQNYAFVLITAPVLEAAHKNELIRFRTMNLLNKNEATKNKVLLRVKDLIHSAEIHEADETFSYEGVRVFNPHNPFQGVNE